MGLAFFGTEGVAAERRSDAFDSAAFKHGSISPFYPALKQPNQASGLQLPDARPCRLALTSPAADPLFPKGTAHELFEYMSAGKTYR